MIEVNHESLARKIVNKCMRVKENEVILLSGGVYNFDLIEAIATNIRKVGAWPVTRVTSDNLSKRIISETPLKYLKKEPKYFVKWLDDIDGNIGIDPYTDPTTLSSLSEKRFGLNRQANRRLNDKFTKLGIRWTAIGYPTKEKAKMFKIPFGEFWDMFWSAMNVNYDAMYRRGTKVARALRGKKKVHITSDKGTDLTFRITGRKPLIDDGVISPQDLRNKDVGNNLPCGEVFLAPVETSANGRAVFDLAFWRGNKITDIDIDFKKGKLSRVEARKNEKLLKEVIANSHGQKDRIGEFGIGINPKVKKAVGYTITDEKIIGTIHIAIGENRSYGGKNEATIHWDFVMMRPTVDVDGKTIMKSGKLTV
ncbi:MAG: aminopeptidase [Thermoplasmata archaeon]